MRTRTKAGIVVLAAVLSLLAGAGIGSVSVSPADICRVLANRLFGSPLPENFSSVTPGLVLNIRLPRVTLSFAAGAAAAMGGVVMQSVLKNPLASPYGLGVSSGAGLGAALVIVSGLGAGALGTLALPAVSLAFGLATVGAAIFLSSRLDRSLSNNTIILTGMVLSLFTNALMSTVSAANPEYSQRILLWQLGSFSGRGWEASAMVAAVAAVCLAGFLRLSPELDAMTFGEEQARALGVIGFVDLIAPHVVRRFFGARHRLVLPMAALLGGAFMTVCDLAARTLASPSEIPVGSITALIGAPFFLYVYFSHRRR